MQPISDALPTPYSNLRQPSHDPEGRRNSRAVGDLAAVWGADSRQDPAGLGPFLEPLGPQQRGRVSSKGGGTPFRKPLSRKWEQAGQRARR